MSQSEATVLIDWGTSKINAWLWTTEADSAASLTDPRGMKFISTGDYPGILDELLQKLGVSGSARILICGMAGARGGWRDAGYHRLPARLTDLAHGACSVEMPGHDVCILPGLASSAPCPDVMRGEETQLAGLAGEDGAQLVCLPGTHSKWARLSVDRVEDFSTFMTGELFEVITKHSILSQTLDDGWDDISFETAVSDALNDPEQVWRNLFSLRAGALLDQSGWESSRARLSGLLIGAEVAAIRKEMKGPYHCSVTLVAGGQMARSYHTAIEAAGFFCVIKDGSTVTRRGLIRAAQEIWSI